MKFPRYFHGISMVLTIIIVLIFLSILILVHELGHFLFAKKFGLLVEEFGMGLPPRIWKKKVGETIYSINSLPFGGFVKIHGENQQEDDLQGEDIALRGRSFKDLAISKRALIIFAGVLMNFIFGWLVISIVFAVGTSAGIIITQVSENTPAAEIGLQANDKILAVAVLGEVPDQIKNWNEFQKSEEFINFINQYRGEQIALKVEREKEILGFSVVPRINPPAGQGALGIQLIEIGFPKQNLLNSFWSGLKSSLEITAAIFKALGALIAGVFTRTASWEAVAGPVGIVKVTAQVSSFGFIYLLQLLALISLNLAVINIFPFPALDGGRLLFLLIEKIKGSPLPIKFERYANAFGMALLLTLMILITIKDVARLF